MQVLALVLCRPISSTLAFANWVCRCSVWQIQVLLPSSQAHSLLHLPNQACRCLVWQIQVLLPSSFASSPPPSSHLPNWVSRCWFLQIWVSLPCPLQVCSSTLTFTKLSTCVLNLASVSRSGLVWFSCYFWMDHNHNQSSMYRKCQKTRPDQ